MKYTPRFEVMYNTSKGDPPSCFPIGYDRSELIEISSMMDSWAKYINSSTGEVVDCALFAARMIDVDRE